jgi:hypothetical protein
LKLVFRQLPLFNVLQSVKITFIKNTYIASLIICQFFKKKGEKTFVIRLETLDESPHICYARFYCLMKVEVLGWTDPPSEEAYLELILISQQSLSYLKFTRIL